MAIQAQQHPDLKAIPMLRNESLYIGIDVAKVKHVAGFVSKTLLERHTRFEACPALTFENSREGFRLLLERIREYTALEQVFVLMERTGHYHKALLQFLQECDIPVYLMHVQTRPSGMLKTDKRDALSLANHLYSQLELGVQVADKLQLVRQAVPPTPAATQLKGLVRHRYELVREVTQRKNKLTALCDELFPEFTVIFHDPNLPTALTIRERFPTPHAIATTSLTILKELRGNTRCLGELKLVELQRLAAETIGTKDLLRQRGLVLEQSQLIREYNMLQGHIEELEREIKTVIVQAREGQILASMGIGPIGAAAIIAAIGSIHNFASAAQLKSYFGWAPVREQTGTSFDRAHLTRGGTRTMKQMMFLIVTQMISRPESEWSKLYERLVKARCPYNERTQSHTGKIRVMGRIAGQMTEMIYALLTRDAEVLSKVPPGQVPPPPLLYDPEIHRRHRQGQYRPLKSIPPPNTITRQPPHPLE